MSDDNARLAVATPESGEGARRVADVGRDLRQARESRGMSREELSFRTKIPVLRLRQIEEGKFAALPPGIYARGMLRAVAREVGRDPERIVASMPREVDDEGAAGRSASAVPTHTATRTDSVTRVHSAEIDAMDVRRRLVQWCAAVVLMLFSGAIYASLTEHSSRASSASRVMDEAVVGVGVSPAAPRAASAAVAPAAAPTPAPAPVTTSAIATAPLATNRQPDDIRVAIRADNVCWVSGTADGQRVMYRLLNAGDEAEVRAAADLVLRVGDPSALRLTINGGPGRPLGRAGEPVTLHVTRENYRDFLEPETGPSLTVSATALQR